MRSYVKPIAVLALALAVAGTAFAVALANSPGGVSQAQAELAPGEDAAAAAGAPQDADDIPAGDAGQAGDGAVMDPAGDGAAANLVDDSAADEADRAALLARWDELMLERRRLAAEMRQVEREMLAIARELWPLEWERTRGRILERLEEYEERMGEYGEEIAEWVPPALVDYIAQRTGRTPEEVRRLIESGQWRELWNAVRGREAESGQLQ